MPNIFKDYLFDRREGHITRWHGQYTQRQESLAEHQYFVTRNVLYICRLLRHFDIDYPNVRTAMVYALCHDAPEKITGDVSGYTKRIYPMLKTVMSQIEVEVIKGPLYEDMHGDISTQYRQEQFEAMDKDNRLEAQIVAYADLLDAYIFATQEHEIGNRLIDKTHADLTHFLALLTWPWLEKLREAAQLP